MILPLPDPLHDPDLNDSKSLVPGTVDFETSSSPNNRPKRPRESEGLTPKPAAKKSQPEIAPESSQPSNSSGKKSRRGKKNRNPNKPGSELDPQVKALEPGTTVSRASIALQSGKEHPTHALRQLGKLDHPRPSPLEVEKRQGRDVRCREQMYKRSRTVKVTDWKIAADGRVNSQGWYGLDGNTAGLKNQWASNLHDPSWVESLLRNFHLLPFE